MSLHLGCDTPDERIVICQAGMFKHPVFTSFEVAIILSLLLGAGMEVAYPRRTGDMFGNEVITVLTFPAFWFLGWLVINAISWWRETDQ